MKDPKRIDYAEFLRMLEAEHPEVPLEFDEICKGLLHCEMAVFAWLAEEAMDAQKFWRAETHFRFISKVRRLATPEVENAIDVSFIEWLALSEFTEDRHSGLKRMPEELRKILLEIDGRRRWA